MTTINLTPHAIVIGAVTYPASGELARVSMNELVTGAVVMGVPVISRKAGAVTGLPDAVQVGVFYLVSGMVLDALASQGCIRKDVFAPDTGASAVRNEKGHIVSVTRVVGL